MNVISMSDHFSRKQAEVTTSVYDYLSMAHKAIDDGNIELSKEFTRKARELAEKASKFKKIAKQMAPKPSETIFTAVYDAIPFYGLQVIVSSV